MLPPVAKRPPAEVTPTAHRILWIDDEVAPGDALLRLCTAHGFRFDVARTGAEGLAAIGARSHDAVIVDLHLPDMFGLTVLQRLRESGVTSPVLAVTGYYLEPEIRSSALRAGATALRYKPFDSEELAAILRSIISGTPEAAAEPTTAVKRAWPYGIVAVSPAMRRIVAWIERVGPTNASALITGATGTGKELVARALHQASARELFVPVNCAAIPESLVETELFGHRKGAFTGATSDKPGVFEAAHRGTLFLDEIGDLPVSLQGRLLRCLENGEVRRVGENRTRRVDVRVIAATNRSLRDDVSQGRFREDLYHRLDVARQNIPPLQERPEDLDALVEFWLPQASQQWRRTVVGVTPGARNLLHAHAWSGNARQLRNVLERAIAVSTGDRLTERDVSEALSDAMESVATKAPDVHDRDDMRRLIGALDAHHWNRTRAARALGVDRTTLWRWLRRYGLDERAEPGGA